MSGFGLDLARVANSSMHKGFEKHAYGFEKQEKKSFSKTWFQRIRCLLIIKCFVVVLQHLGEMPEFCCLWHGYACFFSSVCQVIYVYLGRVCVG